MVQNQKGYTLAELLVVMIIFMVVMTITTTSFKTIITTSGQTVKRGETEIEGLIGLELLRVDLELAGYGLPWSFENNITYTEANSQVVVTGYSGTTRSLYNDAPSAPPRAIVSGDNVGFNGSDYLVLKGSALGASRESRTWTYMTYSSASPAGRGVFKPPKTDLELAGNDKQKVIALRSVIRAGGLTKELVMEGSNFSFAFDNRTSFLPKKVSDSYLVYGIDKEGKNVSTPFNRADYYLWDPGKKKHSARCADGTVVLYKAVLNQADKGGVDTTLYPLLDCVADFQVIYGFSQDSALNGMVDLHQDQVTSILGEKATSRDIREQVREIGIYILAHEGGYDRDYWYPRSTVVVGAFGHGRDQGLPFDLERLIGPSYQHYRWKIYTIVVQPKNLM